MKRVTAERNQAMGDAGASWVDPQRPLEPDC